MKLTLKTRLLASSLLIGAAMLASPAYAQEAEDKETQGAEDVQETVPVTTPDPVEGQTIVVTGSRIRQDAFNSPTPIQVLDADEAAKVGVSSATELLQRSTVASGQQIDATLNTNAGNSNASEAPPTGGAGSSNIDLRGLGQERTLVLVNGRRLGSAGVRGAPAQPDIGLLPLGLIERIDVVTEGASSIYGADAVAGVVNVILKTDYEGMEVFGHVERPEHDGGNVEQVSVIMGTSGERARIMVGAEFYRRDRVRTGDRDFSRSFRVMQVGEDGTIYSIDRDGFFDNVISAIGAPGTSGDGRWIFYTPGQSNTGVPNFSGAANLPPVPPGALDRCTTGTVTNPTAQCFVNFVYHDFYNDQDERRMADLVQPLERMSFVVSGSYDVDPTTDMKAYFEGYYFDRQQVIRAATEQIFPDIPALIPQLNCTPGAPRTSPQFCGQAAVVGYVDNPLNPFPVDAEPIITLDDVPQIFNVNVNQIRIVGGLTGNIPGSFFESRNWAYDLSWTFDRGTGHQSQTILFEPHLFNATMGVYRDAAGNIRCDPIDRVLRSGFLTTPTCTPVNFFNPSFYVGGPNGEGVFENDAQRAYLLGNRTNRTVIEQTIYSAFLSGDLFDISFGGTVRFAAGYEHRNDEIDSQNDITGVQGLNAAENPVTEGETIGSRQLDEVYGEVQVPLLVDQPFAKLLQLDGAVRYTTESNFGSETTYRARGLWRPVSWMQLSGSYGTSYRAPNLREQFLADQGGGVGGQLDPCISANIETLEGVQGESSERFQNLVQNCIAAGVIFTDSNGNGILDQTTLGTAGITTIPTSTGGNAELLPETSRSYTATLSISPPIFGPVDADFSVSYYDIEIKNSVRNLAANVVINRCYDDPNFPDLSSPLCGLITRDTVSSNESRLIELVEAGFVNIGEETVKGLDFNARVRAGLKDLSSSLPNAVFRAAGTLTYQLEREVQTFGESDREDLLGTFGFPKWKGQATVGIETGPWQLLTQVNYIGKQRSRLADPPFNPSFTFAGRPRTIPLSRVGEEWYQDISLTYDIKKYAMTIGIQNLWDNEPPLIDTARGPNRNNAVSSTGYDFIGRTVFLNGRVKF
ncbi:MAG TPA: TonB-dependent receptor [Sphingomicrobium sp.]|nr:TonB-dependent receptor [Sphingomicrobium sp.]